MKIFTPLRIVAFIAALFAALSLGLGVAVAASDHPSHDGDGVGVFNGDQGSKACVHSKRLLERNERNVINYYTIAFNDKNPELAVKLYGGDEYIQHNPLAANGFPAVSIHVPCLWALWSDGGLPVPGSRLCCGRGVVAAAGAGFGDDLVA